MSGPEIRRDGDTWTLTWAEQQVGMGLERLRESSDGLHAEVTVESIRPDARGRLLGPVKLNVLSTESQTRFANTLDKRVNGLQWHGLVVQACAIVAKQYRAPSPTIHLADIATDDDPIRYLFQQLVPSEETTVLYGDGESAKSLLTLRLALSAATGENLPWGDEPLEMYPVMILDWETNARTVANRLRRLAAGMGLPDVPKHIHYRGASRGGHVLRSLEDELPNLRTEVSRLGIGLVIVDSIGFAVSGSLVEDQTARSAMNALRQLSPATRLVVAHVSNATAQQTSGTSRPFGSAFFWNGMRSGVEVRRSEEGIGQGVVEVGLYHRKANDGEHHQPIGLRAEFQGEPHRGPIVWRKQDIHEVADLSVRTSLSSRIRALLKQGAMDTRTLADELDTKESTLRVTLGRMPDVIQLNHGGGRGQSTTWGLAAND